MPKRSETYMLSKKQQILQAALVVAIKKGLARTSLRDISQEVGMSMGSIANYFSKKQEIIIFAAEQARSARAKEIDALLRSPNPHNDFLEWVSAILKDRSFAKSAVIELELITESFRSIEIRHIVSNNAQTVYEALTQLSQDKNTDAQTVRERAKIMLALYYGLAALKILGITPRQEEVMRTLQSLTQPGDLP